jgi:hypothetical protein
MAARMHDVDALSKRLNDVAGMPRSLDFTSSEADARVAAPRGELEFDMKRISGLLLLSEHRGQRDGLH